MKFGRRKFSDIAVIFFFTLFFLAQTGDALSANTADPARQKPLPKTKVPEQEKLVHQQYLDFLEEVYQTMDTNYYLPVKREDFNAFLKKFNRRIYPQIQDKSTLSNYIKWRSAAYLVDDLISPEDTFSAFFPPQAAKKFEQKVLGKKVDLGIEGNLTGRGFEVVRVEPRSNAYLEGLRENDIIQLIDKISVQALTEDEISEKLTPAIDQIVRIDYLTAETQTNKSIAVKSEEYFKQSVFMVPVDEPGVFCLAIRTFNRKTAEDMFRFLSQIIEQGSIGLILDLRGNPGGPPLAAREISSFFLTPNEEMAYFKKKGYPKAVLTVPEIPPQYRYDRQVVILVNDQSGSASELFSGALQRFHRAVLMGTKTAGKVLLKSMFNFSDESMLLLVTSRGYFADGTPYSFSGLLPDRSIEDQDADLIQVAAKYLVSQKRSERN